MGKKTDFTKKIAKGMISSPVVGGIKQKAKNALASEMEVQAKSLRGYEEAIRPDFDKYAYELEKITSFKRNFLLSIVKGVGTAIGATLIAGIVFSHLFRSVDIVNETPIIKDYIENAR